MTVVNGPLRSWVESFGASKEKHHQICSNFSSILILNLRQLNQFIKVLCFHMLCTCPGCVRLVYEHQL